MIRADHGIRFWDGHAGGPCLAGERRWIRGGATALELTEKVLKIRNRLGRNVGLAANEAQQRYHSKVGQRNIVLKARQMGVTTWIAGRFFLKTILHPGTVTVQVAHTQEAAEQIFRIVHRFLDHLPEAWREGALKGARRNARRIVFPEMDSEYLVETAGDRNAGRGLTITNLHCTELARWPGDAAEILYGLMATLSPEGELVMESTPNGACGCFFKEWQEAEKTKTVQHFFPWWLEPTYVGERGAGGRDDGGRAAIDGNGGVEAGTDRVPAAGPSELSRAGEAGVCRGCQRMLSGQRRMLLRSGIDPQTVARGQRSGGNTAERGTAHLDAARGREEYVVAVDPAGGGSEGDYTAMEVIDMETGLQCAELEEHLPPLETAAVAADLARQYNGALLAVERNNHGFGVLAHLAGHPPV